MSWELIISFTGATTLLALMPGPDNIFVLTESVTRGSRQGVAISIGLCLGVLIHTTAAATGVSLLLQQSDLAFSILKYLGAAYFFYLAYQSFREGRITLNLEATKDEHSLQKIRPLIQKGFLMNILNPKVSIFFIAFLPQFVTQDGFSPIWQMIILGGIFMLVSLIVFCGIAILSGQFVRYVQQPRFWRITQWVKISVLVILGWLLLFE